MNLPPEDVKLFYKLFHQLLAYVNQKFKIVEGINSPEDLQQFPMEENKKIRDGLYQHPEVIDSFVAEKQANLPPEELKIVSDWKNFIQGRFLIVRQLKNYTVFLDPEEPPKAYGVLALSTPFEEMFGPYLPVMVEAVLLPFRGSIIYDSIFSRYSLTFGRNVRQRFNDAYQNAKATFGMITSLPFTEDREGQSDAEKLKFYLKSGSNRDLYWQEIEKLISKNPDLFALYHQEMGKLHARKYGKRLREIGVNNAWFAILEGVTIAGGPTKEEVERILQAILPAEKRRLVYLFQLKGKA